MSSILTQNYFELFSLPQQYMLDRPALDARYREMQRVLHPDRYANAGERERRLSMQQAAYINEAYQVLKDSLQRARYLLELRGFPLDVQQNTARDPAFLMQQMELRERLAETRAQADPLQALATLSREIQALYQTLESQLAELLDASETDTEQALDLVLKMQFFSRLRGEVQELEAELEDELY